MASPTVKRLSPGIYEVNGKRINAATSDAALAAYNKANPPKTTTPPKATTPAATTPAAPTPPAPVTPAATTPAAPTPTKWTETLSDQLKELNKVADPTPKQEAKIEELKAIKAEKNAPAAPTPPAPVTPAAPPPPVTTEAAPPPLTANIDTSKVSTTDAEQIKRALGIIDVGEQFGRRIGNEFYSDGSLGRVAEAITPEEQAALDLAKQFSATAGVQTQDVKNLLAQQQGILTNAQQLSPLELEALGVARGSLGGLAAPEMEGLRSAARQNIQGQYQAAARDLAKAQARNQVFGSAATAQNNLLGQAGVREGRNLERDLLVKNIEIKQAAQNAFTGLTTNTEANRAGRTNAASGQLASSTLTDESNRGQLQLGANNSYGTIANNAGNTLRGLQQFNLGSKAAEKAGQVGSIFGGIGTVTGQRGLLAGENFADEQLAASKLTSEQLLKLYTDSLKKTGL